jgi:hypothetical protein
MQNRSGLVAISSPHTRTMVLIRLTSTILRQSCKFKVSGLTQNRSGVVVIILTPYPGTVSSIRLARTILHKS